MDNSRSCHLQKTGLWPSWLWQSWSLFVAVIVKPQEKAIKWNGDQRVIHIRNEQDKTIRTEMRDSEHLLLLCPKWVAERQRYFGDSTDITDVFHDTLFAENVKLSRPVRGRQKATPVAETTTQKNQLTMAETVKSRLCIFSVNHSTLRRVLQKMTA